MLIHPTNPQIVYVCAQGFLTGPQQERGVFKTTDAGATWQRVLFVDPNTSCSGLALDRTDPNTLIAGTWQVEQHTWAQLSGGPGSGVYITHDGGTTWAKVTNGMPKAPVGKIDVAIAPSNSKRMYALIQTADQGSVWRSDDGGTTWKVVSWDRSLIGRAGYYIRMMVNPQNADDVFVMSSSMHRSTDGGATFSGNGGVDPFQGQARCGDCHDVWIDPKDPARYVVVDDGGGSINTPQGPLQIRIPNGQMYHVHVDNQVPYWIYSNRQDDGTMRGPSTNSEQTGRGVLPPGSTMPERPAGGRGGRGGFGGRGGGAAQPEWQPNIGGCESGFTIPDPVDPNIVYASCYGNKVTRWDARTGTARSIEPWMVTLDSPPNQAKYRCHWTAPMAIDPFDHNTVLYGCQVVLKTTNGGQSWSEASPDLSTKDPSRIVSNGGLVGDNLGQYNGEVDLGHRVLEDSEGPDLGRHERREVLVHQGRRRKLDRRQRELQGPAAVGHVHSDLAVHLRSGHGLHGGIAPPDGRSEALHLQVHGLRDHVDEDHRQHPVRQPAGLRPVLLRESRTGRACCSPGAAAPSTTRWTTARPGRGSRTDCRQRP